jgi:DNA-binding NarL/FixJ family response regulator
MKTRVYIVDDHTLVRRGLSELIGAERDMEVCGQAGSSMTALAEIMKLHPACIIVDISLGDHSGIELIKSIKAFDSRTQIVVFSMHDEAVYAQRVLRAGARAYVMKQEVGDKLVEAIRRIAKGRVYVSDAIAGQMRLAPGDPTAGSSIDELSDRELEIANLIGHGITTRMIAQKLHISIKTVETHRGHIKSKLGAQNATQLVQLCVCSCDDLAALPRVGPAG